MTRLSATLALALLVSVPFAGPGEAADVPTAGCEHYADPKADGTPTFATVAGNPVALPNDPTLDVTSVTFRSDDKLAAYIKIDKLSKTTARGNGARYEWTFTANSKAITLLAQWPDTVAQATIDAQRAALTAAGLPATPNTAGRVAGTYDPRLKVTSELDLANNQVVLAVDKASLEAVIGAVSGEVTGVQIITRMLTPTGGSAQGDLAPSAVTTWTVGDSKCFGPPPATLANAGATTVAFSDAASVAGKLLSAAGAPLAGKTVTFKVGSVTASAVTGSDGVARTTLDPKAAAGSYDLVTRFAGDASAAAAEVTTPFTVTAEATKITFAVSPRGAARSIAAKLTDDDAKPLAGQPVAFSVNGTKVATVTTNAAGIATYASAKAGQTVKADYAGVAGKYLGTSLTKKV